MHEFRADDAREFRDRPLPDAPVEVGDIKEAGRS
jgi:hypothetical protein